MTLGDLARFVVPLAPSTEQQRVAEEVERRLSAAQELEATVEANLKRAERLRQAILKAAFEGRLVPQDPTDEPASMLLERIRGASEKNEQAPGLDNLSKPSKEPSSAQQLRLIGF